MLAFLSPLNLEANDAAQSHSSGNAYLTESNEEPALTINEPMCSGSMILDTQIGGNLATQEVFNEKTTSFLYA